MFINRGDLTSTLKRLLTEGTNFNINQSIVRPFFQGVTNVDNIVVIGETNVNMPIRSGIGAT